MSTIVLPAIQFREIGHFLRNVAEVYSEANLDDGYMKNVGNMMLNLIAVRFATAKDAKKRLWKSTAESTRLGGRFSIDYKKRPSGRKVTGSSKRLSDTGEFRESYKILYQTGKKVVAGPTGKRNMTIAEAANDNWDNKIAGWSKKDVSLANKELETYLIKRLRGY